MIERAERLVTIAKKPLEKCFLSHCKRIFAQMETDDAPMVQGLRHTLEALFSAAAKLQKTGKKQPIAYLTFSVLQSNLLLNRHAFQLDAYDTTFFLDDCEVTSDWNIEWLFSQFQEDCTLVGQQLRTSLPRVQAYELNEIWKAYSLNYYTVAATLLSIILPNVLADINLHDVLLTEEVQCTTGAYMEKQQHLYTWRVRG